MKETAEIPGGGTNGFVKYFHTLRALYILRF